MRREYDPQCEALARYFLGQPARDEALVVELAGVIQEAIEDWEQNRQKEKTSDATDTKQHNR
ncbi:MAG TPA: hypothetical protein VE030_11340 [Burkholderiales bacterium]|nr:hypothetical protein [Burkholderiales bacterium]